MGPSHDKVQPVSSSITELYFVPLAVITFDSGFVHFKDVFQVDFSNFDDPDKARLSLVTKLRSNKCTKYIIYNDVLSRIPHDISFKKTIVKKIFGAYFLFKIRQLF